jgi:hypothetical protein
MKKIHLNGKNFIDEITKYTIVDDEDFETLNKIKWYRSTQGYSIEKSGKLMHRVLKSAKKGEYVDHIDGDKLNNQKKNLRICTNEENGRNQVFHKNNTSGFKGVSYDKARNKWFSQIMVNYKHKGLGRFPTKEEAYEAYCKAAKLYHGEFANFG